MLRQALGKRGERQAESFLKSRGLKLVTRNWRCRHGEIDLVMRHGDHLVFVEVRLRASTRFADSAESVGRIKRRRLELAARDFLARNPGWSDHPARFDVIGLDHGGQELRWIENAFEAQGGW